MAPEKVETVMSEMSIEIVLVILLILSAEFVNGWTDAPNAVATVISTRVLRPITAVIMASLFNLAGVLLAGTAVATTIGKGIVNPEIAVDTPSQSIDAKVLNQTLPK